MKQFIKKFKQISILILAISLFGCEDDEVELPQVVAGFTYTINEDTGTVTFINISENSSSYTWNLGDGNDSTEKNPINTYTAGEYTIILTATNVAGASETFEYLLIISDVGAPVITLLGDTTMNILVGGTFTDPGATAMDDLDGDITASIVVAGDIVDVNTAATYILTYNVSDAAGNAATERTRTVIVAADLVAPVITLIGNGSMNVEIGGTFTDPGATATDDIDGDVTANIVVAGDTVDVNVAATYTITYNVSDAAGNAATEVTRTVVVAAAGMCTAETSESMSASNLDVTFMTDQSANIISDGAGFEWVDNPDADNAVNSSCKVGKINKSGQFAWDNNQIDLDAKLDFDANAGLKVKVFSAVPGFKVLLKLEEIGNAGNNVETELTTTKTNEWEELTFPISTADSNKFDKIVIFFDLNANNTDTYYFDDLKLYERTGGPGPGPGPGGEIAENGDFETGTFDGWATYLNGGSITIDNTQSNGGTFSAKMVADPSGLNPTLKQERKGAGTIVAGDLVQITFDYMGSLAGESGTFSMQSFVEAAAGVNQVETFTVTPTNTWQTFTTTYTVNAGDVSGGITMEFVAICGGVPGCESVLYLDNVSVKVNP